MKKKSYLRNEPSLHNIKLTVEYDGKNYFGWQKQNHKPSIQDTIEKSLQILFPGEKIKLTGAGRTDAGVHALNQVANFKISKDIFDKLTLKKFVYSLNSILPYDIAVKKVNKVNLDFHSRYSAKKRIYKYHLSEKKRALYSGNYFYTKTKFDIDLAKEFCNLLKGTHCFRYLCKNKHDSHNFMSKIFHSSVKKQKDGLIVFEICANRYLHSMVRAIVGMMIRAASSKLTLNDFKRKFKKKEPLKIQYVPPYALVLDRVFY